VRLIKANVSGYKRLARDCQLNLDADPVCIVGPNAAGKSSFLDALVHLNSAEDFAHTERTRVPGGQTLEPYIEARFVLDGDDLELLKSIPEAAEVRQLRVIRQGENSVLSYSADPYPHRDLTKREELREQLKKLESWIEQTQAIEQAMETPPDPLVGALFSAAVEVAASDNERVEDEARNLDALGQRLGPMLAQIRDREQAHTDGEAYDGPDWPELPDDFMSLPAELAALAGQEQEDHPLRRVRLELEDRVPKFLKFDDAARSLETKYDLSGDEPEAGLGIHSFLALAGTSWTEAVEVVQRDDPGWTKTWVEDRDNELKQQAALKWGQSDIEVAISLNGSILSILLSMQAHDFIGFDDHSDGLKAFVALRAFISQETEDGSIKPIVLIDEADLHLHYDAQADMIGVFEEQQEAAQIIYTTHSAGCLPRDLAGVRAIVPETEERDDKVIQKDHSEAINRFWTKGRGYSPLLLAMGAGAFAFSATQYAVITEGMSDALLLPTLIREATGEKRLRYQAVPSFAEATADEIRRFDLMAGRIAFLADGDEGGRNHVQRLLDNGIAGEQIIYLGGDSESGLSIEDLLAKDIYLKAVNDELDAWHQLEYPASMLPETGRSKAVEDWCAEQTGRNGQPVELSKVDVAQRVLDQREPGVKLLAKAPTMKKAHENILAVLEGARDRIRQLREQAAVKPMSEREDDRTAA
jgi:AAA domain, putative AbiEii toxin, Type IV TA system